MTAVLTGVFTNIGRETLAKSLGNLNTGVFVRAAKIKYGEGGYLDTPSGRIPKDPYDGVTLTDVEAAAGGLFWYEKNLSPSDFLYIAPSTIQIRCRLDASEANDNGSGDNPRFFELGIFDDNDNLLIWTTFAEQTKDVSKLLTNFVQVIF